MEDGTSDGEHRKGELSKLKDSLGETTEAELAVNKYRLERDGPSPSKG